jgi:signal transduction histidine kinase
VHTPSLSRTIAFRLTLLYSLFFAACVILLLGFVYWQTATEMTRRIDQIITLEKADLLATDHALLADKIDKNVLGDRRHVYFYGLFTADGHPLAGNIVHFPSQLADDQTIREIALPVADAPSRPTPVRAVVTRLPDGSLLVVGHNARQLAEFNAIMGRALLWGGALTILIGLAFGLILGSRPLRRIEQMQQACECIISGDIRQRLPVTKHRDELDMLAAIVNRMLDEIERLMSEVKSVCDNIAHDLRTPLTRLRAGLYRAQQQLDGSSAQRPVMEQAIAEVDALLSRFRALLRISEIENKERRAGFKLVHLEELLGQAVNFFAPLAEDKAIQLQMTSEVTAPILGDMELLFEAIANLLDNAIKFTPPGGHISVSLTQGMQGAQIDICDSGSGIKESERAAVLNRFYRGTDQPHTPGYGLGLSIVAAITRLHHFEFELANLNPGTRVTIFCQPRMQLFAEHPQSAGNVALPEQAPVYRVQT